MHRPFFPAYVAGEPQARALLPPGYHEAESRIRTARRAAERRTELVPAGTAAVVTGQQMGLFLGPLYTFYKAASAVVFARALEAESGVRVIPVFWLQTEDHDFPEIGHCHVPARLEIADGGLDAHVSAAHRRLGDDVTAQIDRMELELAGLPHAAEVVALVREHWRPGRTLPQAFAGMLSALLPELLLVDPRTPEIAKLAAPVHRRAIARAAEIDAALADRGRALAAAGFDEQVHPRPGTTLCFIHEGSPEGPRHRPAPSPELLQLDPMRYSSSALLRPIVQDTLLPTAVYVAGPGELNYFAQVAALYPLFDLAPPVVAPRARFRVIDPHTRTLLGKLGLAPAEAEKPRDQLLRAQAGGSPEQWRQKLLAPFAELDALAGVPNLGDAVKRTRETVAHAVGRFVDRYARALAEKDGATAARIDRVQGALLPGGVPQERFLGLPPLLARIGIRPFTERVLAEIRPFEAAIRDIDA